MCEDMQKVKDNTLILGDILPIGRAFRTSVDQHIKENLIIFVTARLVTPSGQPLTATEEEEEGPLQQPALPEVARIRSRSGVDN
jgi:general secretion pathway protein D